MPKIDEIELHLFKDPDTKYLDSIHIGQTVSCSIEIWGEYSCSVPKMI